MRTIPNKNIRSAKVWGYVLGVAFSTVCPAMGKTDSFFKEPVIFLHSGPNETTTVQSIDRFGPLGIAIELRLPAFRMGVKSVEEGSPEAAPFTMNAKPINSPAPGRVPGSC